jgi:hypothetical protein
MKEASKRFYRICCYASLLGFMGVAAVEVEVVPSESGNVILKKFPVKASQGVAVDGKWFYAISNTKISKCDKKSGKVIAEWEADRKKKAEAHFKHLNSGTVVEEKLYCAHSRFPLAANDCTVEIFGIAGEVLEHMETITMPAGHGSLTWIDQHDDGSWWMGYAVYGKGSNNQTKLVKYRREDGRFIEERSWFFPKDVVAKWGTMSCSGGSWGRDGNLYVTGHDGAEAYVLKIDEAGGLVYVRTEKQLGIFGQAIAWDRSLDKPVLWGIVKNQFVSLTLVSEKEDGNHGIKK